jgi:hypothetical protein
LYGICQIATDTGIASNVDQLRSRIDQGETGDKVDFPDPAAAPLGTDAEAAGVPVSDRELAMEAGSAARAGPLDGSNRGDPTALAVYIGIIVVLALGFLAILAWSLLRP